MNFKKLFLGIILSGAFLTANAQYQTPGINQVQKNQQKRIVHGVANGELTKKEFICLEAQQKSIHKQKKAAKADGVVTVRERKNIKSRQVNASGRIYKQKHDRQDRF